MAQEKELLTDLLRLQEQIRSIENDDLSLEMADPDGYQFHKNLQGADGRSLDTPSTDYVGTFPTSVPAGQAIIKADASRPGDIEWADAARGTEAKGGTGGFEIPEGCANGTNCLDENFCYSWHDCEPCQWCENFVCVDRDPNRVCNDSWECPCAPDEESDYKCLDGHCALSCQENGDCPFAQVCDPRDFRCKPGCNNDTECKPGSSNAAPDARSGSLCLNSECVTPCEPPVLCDGPNDFTTCPEGDYCADKAGNQSEGLYQCTGGCANDDQCPPDVYTDKCDKDADPDCEDTEIKYPTTCIENSCVRVCNKDSQCDQSRGEGCVENRCQNVGVVCRRESDCDEGQYCDDDGRCKSGCDSDGDCIKPCPPDADCVAACPPDPNCTCEGCDPNDPYWKDELCERDLSCVRACPRDVDCLRDVDKDATCFKHSCIVRCNNSGDCRDGYGCVEDTEDGIKKCVWVDVGGQEEVCEEYEDCVEIGGDVECEITRVCQFVSPKIDSDYFGCGCGDSCNQKGQCVTTTCIGDADCESCSYCKGGVCVEGCDDENPCPPGEVCTPEGKCATACETDADCTLPEVCLSGGYCGLACEPTIPCRGSFECPEGTYCEADTETCENGCRKDDDCGLGQLCWQQNCEISCVSNDDCDGDTCGPNGFCIAEVATCRNDTDCADNYICREGSCSNGCRLDSECTDGETCSDNRCEFFCTDDEECEATDRGNKCERSTRAAELARDQLARLEELKSKGESVSAKDISRLKQLSKQKSKLGYCRDLGRGGEELSDGCTEFEVCDENGQCVPVKCSGDADCFSGQCLSDGYCGECGRDADCTNGRICEKEEGEATGVCVYSCIPEQKCESNAACPAGTFCNTQLGVCELGCRASEDCLPGTDCRRGECLNICGEEGSGCFTEDGWQCLSGLCEFVGFKCKDDGDCPPDRGWCVQGSCEEDLRCLTDQDCGASEVCENGLCEPGKRCKKNNDCLQGCESNRDCSKTCLLDSECGDWYKKDDDGNEYLHSEGKCFAVGQDGEPGYCMGGTDGDTCKNGGCQGDNPTAGRYCNSGTGLCQQGKGCDSDTDCVFPLICHQGQCTFERRCAGDNGCQEGEYCSYRDGNVCKVDDRCLSDDDCSVGFVCGIRNVCVEDYQAGGEAQSAGCDCGSICNSQTFTCRQQQCRDDEDCECGFCSSEGLCTDTCKTSNDCQSGKFCSCDQVCEEMDSIPCESSDCCPSGYFCKTEDNVCCLPCDVDNDCEGGLCDEGCCRGQGNCQTHEDCENGFCLKGDDGNTCVECRNGQDCANAYGDPAFECVDNACVTPCYTALSTGDCQNGLGYGDTCKNCPASCPDGSVCTKSTTNVCDTTYYFDPVEGREVAIPVMCTECLQFCTEDKECAGESLCEPDFDLGAKVCKAFNGQCTNNEICGRALNKPEFWDVPWENSDDICASDEECSSPEFCDEFRGRCRAKEGTLAPYQDKVFRCKEFACEQLDDPCFADSDCRNGTICGVEGFCVEDKCRNSDGPNACGVGRTCIDGECRWICGGAQTPFVCSEPQDAYDEEVVCPPEFSCNSRTNLCSRDGYKGVGPVMGCPTGEYCFEQRVAGSTFGSCKRNEDCNESGATGPYKCFGDGTCAKPLTVGGCLPMIFGQMECREDVHCDRMQVKPGYEWRCEDGICEMRPDEGCPPEDRKRFGPSCNPPTEGRDDVEDTCTRLGKCCGADGFCISCGCDDENPCEGDGECCSKEGLCVDRSVHPMTKWGAPASCSYGEIFCEVLGPEGDDGTKSVVDPTEFQSKGYAGCETIVNEDGTREERCWEGGPLRPSQIRVLMAQECTPSESDEKDECACDPEMPTEDECFTSEDCGGCGVCESKTWQGDACCPLSDAEGNDFVTFNICKSEKDCDETDCFSDEDCTECEVCTGATIGQESKPGRCEAKCEEKCPCGGQLSSSGNCPTCEEVYGDCVETYTPEGEDELCGCRVKTEMSCCATFASLEETLTKRDGCRYISTEDANGTVFIQQVDYCRDFEADACAQCTQDSHCFGNSVCRGYKCVTECGDEDALKGSAGDCSCCTDDGECKELYESWSDAREVADGGNTRPCTCTSNGIECGPYVDAQSCYRYVLTDGGSDENAKADRLAAQDALTELKTNQEDLQMDYADSQFDLNTAAAELDAAKEWQGQACPEEDSEECTAAKEAKDAADQELQDGQETMGELTGEIADLDDEITNKQARVDILNQYIDQACLVNPNSEDCQEAFAEVDQLTGEIDAAKARRGTLVLEKNQLEIVLEAAQAEADFWLDEKDKYCTDTEECNDAKDAVDAAQIKYDNAAAAGSSAYLALVDNEANIASLELTIADSPYRAPTFTQQRICECCIDGQCRPEADCTYGTCYLCETQGSQEKGNHYRSQFWTSAVEAETCTGCVDQAGERWSHPDCPDDAGGPSGVYFEMANECVKYRCEDGIATYQQTCSGDQVKWYDYCVGSILGCVWSSNDCQFADECAKDSRGRINYWNGYEFNMWCPLAGLWAFNAKSMEPRPAPDPTFGLIVPSNPDWVQLQKPIPEDGQDRTSLYKSKCAYPNPLGHIQGNWISDFEGVSQLHKCCAFSLIYSECDPDYPDCASQYEIIFEPSATDGLVDRLKQQVDTIDRYFDELERVEGELNDLKTKTEGELSDLNQKKEELSGSEEDAKASIEYWEGEVADRTQALEDAETDKENAQKNFDDAADKQKDKSDEKNAAIKVRDDIQDEIGPLGDEKVQVEANIDSVKNAIRIKDGQVNAIGADIKRYEQQQIALGCVCPEGAPDGCEEAETLECFELEQELTQLQLDLQESNDELTALYEEANDLQDQLTAINDEIGPLADDLDNAQNEVNRLTDEWLELTDDLGVKNDALEDAKAEVKQARIDLNVAVVQLQNAINTLEGIQNIDVGELADIDKEIENVQTVLDNIEESLNWVTEETEEYEDIKYEKCQEIKRLEDELDEVDKPEGSSRPDSGTTLTELADQYAEQVQADKDASENEWYPEG